MSKISTYIPRSRIAWFFCRIGVKARARHIVPEPGLLLYRSLRNPREASAIFSFLTKRSLALGLRQRLRVIGKLYAISWHVSGTHFQDEMISFIEAILSLQQDVRGCLVEAGSFKGASTAKFSLAAKIAKRQLVVFDSFEGIPENIEPHDKNISGGRAKFSKGDYCGSLEEVKENIRRFGNIEVCRFIKGWFDETMPGFKEPVAAAYLDVDLASSTRTCLKYLFPLVVPGGVLFSQDGHLPLVIQVFEDEEFWNKEVGCARPHIERLGERLLKIAKPLEPRA